jgi:hypothetical protein
MGMDNTTCPSEGPVAGCAVGGPSVSQDEGLRSPTRGSSFELWLGLGSLGWLANAFWQGRNVGHRLPGGTPCAGEPHARCGRGREETRR